MSTCFLFSDIIHTLILSLGNVITCFLVKLSFLIVGAIVYLGVPCVRRRQVWHTVDSLSVKILFENVQVHVY